MENGENVPRKLLTPDAVASVGGSEQLLFCFATMLFERRDFLDLEQEHFVVLVAVSFFLFLLLVLMDSSDALSSRAFGRGGVLK